MNFQDYLLCRNAPCKTSSALLHLMQIFGVEAKLIIKELFPMATI